MNLATSSADSRAGGSAPRRTRARRGAGVPHRARDAEAHRRRSEPRRRSHPGAGALRPGTPRRRPVSRRARHHVVDDLTRDIVYAFRTFRRAPLAALTVVATVALGLGLVAVVFTVYTLMFLRVDAVRSPGELFAVELARSADSGTDESVSLARPDYDAMRRETSVFTDRPRCWTEARRTSTGVSRGHFS